MGFDFDAHVRAMRASKDPSMIPALYRALFALDRWCFLDDPTQPGHPVVWRFERGVNPAPCVLAFTDEAKAMACARTLSSLGAIPRVIAAPRADAVPWMVALPPPIDWACFNFAGPTPAPASGPNFPLYFDEARRFHAATP